MLKELLNKTYQNFYVNEDNIIVGIVTPKERWKILNPEILMHYLIDSTTKCKEQLKRLGNYEPLKNKISKNEKMIKKLNNAMSKRRLAK